jgi:hypothetical protein
MIREAEVCGVSGQLAGCLGKIRQRSELATFNLRHRFGDFSYDFLVHIVYVLLMFVSTNKDSLHLFLELSSVNPCRLK